MYLHQAVSFSLPFLSIFFVSSHSSRPAFRHTPTHCHLFFFSGAFPFLLLSFISSFSSFSFPLSRHIPPFNTLPLCSISPLIAFFFFLFSFIFISLFLIFFFVTSHLLPHSHSLPYFFFSHSPFSFAFLSEISSPLFCFPSSSHPTFYHTPTLGPYISASHLFFLSFLSLFFLVASPSNHSTFYNTPSYLFILFHLSSSTTFHLSFPRHISPSTTPSATYLSSSTDLL